ncbi:MAG: alpha/beta fold hydrolase [Sphingobacteriales bacterium]|nr:MAG: alpha/beta fold hydrolase [Sphingobacteriales bacterium]
MRSIFALLLIIACSAAHAQMNELRKAWMGANGTFSNRGMAIDTVMQGGTFHAMGMKKGDTIIVLNNATIKGADDWYDKALSFYTGDKINLVYKRGKKIAPKTGTAVMRPYETSDIADVQYGWVDMSDCTLRTIVRKPKGAANAPAILLIPGYNCGSIENYNQGSYGKLINTWLRGGFAVITIEKSGLGDSYGCVPCIEADLAMDIRVFEAGYKHMESLSFVDKNNLFIWGHSMGGVIAPLIAEKHKPRGVIAYATVFRPWSEFLLEMHRVQLPLDGKTYAETEDYVRGVQKIYYEFFRLKKSPEELHQNPEYAAMVEKDMEYKPGKTDMWGRHWRFWQQIDSLDLARSWAAVDARVLSVFGGADFVACSELEHELIVHTVNSTHPGNAMHMHIPDLDHLLTRNPDWPSAHKHFMDAKYKAANFHQEYADKLVSWMKSVMAQ